MDRAEVLNVALHTIAVDRESTHGGPNVTFRTVAGFWSTYLQRRCPGIEIKMHDVAAMMILFKVARITTNPAHMDSWIDSAGYSGLGAEVVEICAEPPPDASIMRENPYE